MTGYAARVSLRVKAATVVAQKTNSDLADALGMKPGAVSDRFAGRREWTLSDLEKVAPVLGTTASDLASDR